MFTFTAQKDLTIDFLVYIHNSNLEKDSLQCQARNEEGEERIGIQDQSKSLLANGLHTQLKWYPSHIFPAGIQPNIDFLARNSPHCAA